MTVDPYKSAGVDYDVLDTAKRDALAAALSTSRFLTARGGDGLDDSRGEPAFVFRIGGELLALVLECLGTKSLLCRTFEKETGTSRFRDIGYDTVAAIVNDVVAVGAIPLVVNAYFATGSPDWIRRSGRFADLVRGFSDGCADSGATWGGGETPTLQGVVAGDEVDLAGAAVGRVPPGRSAVLGTDLAAGDRIVLLASSGIHTNGITLARRLAADLPAGLQTPLPSGESFGSALLRPSFIYVGVIQALLDAGVTPSYLTHISGHGFRKIMRAAKPFTYRIEDLLPVPESLAFLSARAALSNAEAYGILNMGAGFAVYCRPSDVATVQREAKARGIASVVAGTVEAGPRQVVLESIGVRYGEDALRLR